MACTYILHFHWMCIIIWLYSTAHFKLDDTRVQQLHDSTRFQKCPQHFPHAHDRPMTYYHWKLHTCMHFVGVCGLNCKRARTRRSFCWRVWLELHACLDACILCTSAKFSARKEHSCINCLHELHSCI